MKNPFEDAKLLVRQARNDIAEFVATCEPFFDGTRNEEIIEVEPKIGKKVLKRRFTFGMPELPERARTLPFNIANPPARA